MPTTTDVGRTSLEPPKPVVVDDVNDHGAKIDVTGQWQRASRPLMVRMLVGLSVFFLLASAVDLVFLHNQVLKEHDVDITQAFAPLAHLPTTSRQELLEETRLRAVILLESNTLARHYHQASALVLARLWKNYVGFVTGMILSMVGAAFVLGKLDAPPSELTTKGAPGEFTFKTASPGLMLALLGVILMVTTLVSHTDIDVKNGAVYLRDAPSAGSHTSDAPQLPPPLPPPAAPK